MAESGILNEYGETVYVERPDQASDAALDVAATPQQVAESFLRTGLASLGLERSAVAGPDLVADAATPQIEFATEKDVADTKVVVYKQTVAGLDVFEATMGMQVDASTLSLEAVQSSMHGSITIENPDARATGGPLAGPSIGTDGGERTLTNPQLKKRLGIVLPELSSGRIPRQVVYRYEPDQREEPRAGEGCFTGTASVPSLPPTTLAGLAKGRHYIVDEVLFDAALADGQPVVHWRALIEPTSGDVLYIRPLVACATGLVFDRDPQTQSGAAVTAASPNAVLNPFRISRPLAGLGPATPQPLTGAFVTVQDVDAPASVPPVGSSPAANFVFDVRTDDFAALNAYHNCDRLFRTMEGFGFTVTTYFNNTTFPVPVDHRALGDAINAQAPGNATGNGLGRLIFGRMMPGEPVGIATDNRVVWHEFGHGLLWDHVSSPNFGFAHSAGDGLGAILNAPESQALDKGQTFPWVQAGLPGLDRRHDRTIAAGWAWFGPNWNTQYGGEQVLSTTLFRLYRSIGGDASAVATRRRAASTTAYLIFKGIGLLTSTTPFPEVYVGHLQTADLTTAAFQGIAGGALHKVVRWAFEQQGLFQPAARPGQGNTVNRVGDPPAVDVYIDDGRGGEYGYQANHWSCQDMWVRRAPDGGTTHQEPVVGATNHLYVRVTNRGTQSAQNVRVDAYHANPGTGLLFPDDWQPMDTPTLPAGVPIVSGGSTVVGPFAFVPTQVAHECLLAIAHADGDAGNDTTITGTIPEHRLVPFDNNIGQRNVCPVLPDLRAILRYFREHVLWVRNPFPRPVTARVEILLPRFLRQAGWQLRADAPTRRFELGPRAERKLVLAMEPGDDVGPEVIRRALARGDDRIELRTHLDGELSGGMSYPLTFEADTQPTAAAAGLPTAEDQPALIHPALIHKEVAGLDGRQIRTIRLEIDFTGPAPVDGG
jgi:zinc metalloprotease ZmpB